MERKVSKFIKIKNVEQAPSPALSNNSPGRLFYIEALDLFF
jgi:hypothetical protein